MKTQLNIGLIGAGARGMGLLHGVILHMEDINIVAVCDTYADRAEGAANAVNASRGTTPVATTDYKEILAMPEVDAIVISSAWTGHIQIAIEAMEAGKYVGMEVGGAYSVEECWDLVKAYERTGVPCMMLENCCYGREELMVLNMVKKGIFGEVVHCQGGYQHDLREEIGYGKENRHYRLVNYSNRNCENYPTHEIGPIAKVLDINRGNRMLSLTSMSSKARGMHEYIAQHKSDDETLMNRHFTQGDVVTTSIKCAHGETIIITLDTTLPRAYSRGFRVQGTKAMFLEDNMTLFLDGEHNQYDFKWNEQWGNVEKYREQYDHPLWKQFLTEGVQGGHGGMDWLVLKAFFECAKAGSEVPIDAYDTAAWMCIGALSEQSIAMGSMPVAIPDFTNGKWMHRQEETASKYCLSRVCDELYK
ncbi:Gfo/Idh/MocA family protein [Niameybacter massiliensis]|uniref:Gfo/Idh/MocA family protein n=1 Tax=Niameybacter massiliensis TaxID=1658108 RepID=UPI0006B53458|nr:Gfo/Idh/MocA family oxidoreductase [Niameybacter massiliensis]